MRQRLIRIAAAVLFGPDGRTLVVRKQGSDVFMQPGGKIDPGETPLQALVRELEEELGLVVVPNACVPIGRFRAPAANEPDAMAEADAFLVPCDARVSVRAELAEIRWIDPDVPGDIRLARLSREHILPAWRRRA